MGSPAHRFLISTEIALTILLLLARMLSPDGSEKYTPIHGQEWGAPAVSPAIAPAQMDSMRNSTANEAVMRYAKMALPVFALFVPSLVMLFAIVYMSTIGYAANNGIKDARRQRKMMLNERRWIIRLISISSSGLFVLLSMLVATAEMHSWVLLSALSIGTPAMIVVLLASLPVVHARSEYMCTNPFSWCMVKSSSYYTLRAIRLASFVFIFLPFLAGLFGLVSPLCLLAVPFSSLVTCTLAGVLGTVVPALLGVFVATKITYWAMTRIYSIYNGLADRSFLLLALILSSAILLSMVGERLQHNVPLYL